ncbi:MAG: hypothetical protein M1830_001328 [Pleopsidium flavum]|nr:MAG: hypothetical protein M1830_001328 [Pleopsidium flavum]
MPPTLAAKLKRYIGELPIRKCATAAATFEELDKYGTALWNSALRMQRQDATSDYRNTLGLGIATAQYLHDRTEVRETLHWYFHVNYLGDMRIGLTVTVAQKQNDSVMRVLERAAWYQEALEKSRDQLSRQEILIQARLSTEYFVLRTIQQSWREDRLDLAEHMFSKACVSGASHVDPGDAERITDLLYEMGHDLLEQRQYDEAAKWLERAYDVLTRQDVEKLSHNAEDLRISVTHSLVKALLCLQREDARSKAWNLVNILEYEVGDKLVVLLLKSELISTNPEFEAAGFYDGLRKIIQTVHLTSLNLNTIMQHVHKLKSRNSHLACKALEQLLCERILDTDKESWVEKAVITRIWISTTTSDSPDTLCSLRGFLTMLTTNQPKSLTLTASATHAAQILLWKQIEMTCGQQQYDVAESWCRLALHPVFERSGSLNVAKIERKLILCALGRQDLTSARELYLQMSEASRTAPMTQYLMYKVAVRSDDEPFGKYTMSYFWMEQLLTSPATECLDTVCDQSSKDATILYACVLEAQQVGNKRQAATALQRVSEKYDYGSPRGIHLPALLRQDLKRITVWLEY